MFFNPLNAELNPICHLLALVGAHHILHVSRVRVNTYSSLLFIKTGKKLTHKGFLYVFDAFFVTQSHLIQARSYKNNVFWCECTEFANVAEQPAASIFYDDAEG